MQRKRYSRFFTPIALGTSLIFLGWAAAQEPKYALQFTLVDSNTGEPIQDAAILYKEDESTWFGDGESSYETDAYWLPFQVIRNGKVVYQGRSKPEMGKSHFQILANGYQGEKIKLKDLLQNGQPIRKIIELGALPSERLRIETQDGTPVARAAIKSQIPRAYAMTFRAQGGHLMKHLFEIDAISDTQGNASFLRPAFGEWGWYRIESDFGHADFSFEAVSAEQASVAERIVKLRPRVTIHGSYRPKIRKNEYLKIYTSNYDRISGDGDGEFIRVSEDGTFELTNRLATWNHIVHWSFFVDENGDRRAFSLGSFGPIQPQDEMQLDIGKDSVHVTGRLIAKDGRKFSNGFQIYASGGGKLSYPHEPKGLKHQESVKWWDATWDSPKGHDYLDYLTRNVQVPVSSDGKFHFPLLPAGKYELVLHSPSDGNVVCMESKFTLTNNQLGKTVDLGDLKVLEARESGAVR